MAKHPASITSLPPSLADDQKRRMIVYTITMGIRIVCIAVCFFVQGWWLVVPAIGAIFLPYFAVVVANAVDSRSSAVERPGSVVPYRPEPPRSDTPNDSDGAAS
ncbi:MAG: DUF3099 domain-containing protein [Cryobacterium sp.]|nr:DUF3099 domain-containing protein [Cryobacterium sp.]